MGLFEELENQIGPSSLTAANPRGVNGYDKGMAFQEGEVERDSGGKFAPEGRSHSGRFGGRGGSNLSDRLARRRASMERSRKAREEKESKSEKSKTDKATRERERAQREAQREALGRIALSIAQAVAAGDTVRAAQLRVERAQLRLSYAETEAERLSAQTALVNAQAALTRASKPDSKNSTAVRHYGPLRR